MKRIDLLFFDAGGGHRSAANALKHVIEQQGRPWEVRLVHLQDVLKSLDVFRRITGISSEDMYNLFLRKGWTLGSPTMLKMMHVLIRSYHGKQVEILRRFWKEDRPDLVVALIPNFSRSIFQSLRAELPVTPMVTVLTDMADYPPHFWMEKQDQYFICGTRKAVEQARDMGHPAERVRQTSGMILNPKYYEPVVADRAELGFDANVPTGVVLFGGAGSHVMLDIAKKVQAARLKLQLIMICGHNAKLAEKLKAVTGPVKMHIEGFTREVPRFMKMADFMIGKPGPGSISEAMAMKLPVIVERNAWTLPQERYNADWVLDQGVGIVLDSFKDIVGGVEELLQASNYQRYREAVAAQNNQAVFEIPEMLAQIMGE
jgi:Glycosyltransferase family 28 C-terminal domain/Monogalactosyldiacylglycerol (MGDG) synthase